MRISNNIGFDMGGYDFIPSSWMTQHAVAKGESEEAKRERESTEIAQRLCETREQIDHTGS